MLSFSIKLYKINDTPSNFYIHQYEVKYPSAAFIDPVEVVLSHAGRHFSLFLRCQTFLLNCITATFSVAVHVEITCEKVCCITAVLAATHLRRRQGFYYDVFDVSF